MPRSLLQVAFFSLMLATSATLSWSISPASAQTGLACEASARTAATQVIEQWHQLAGRADTKTLTSLYAHDAVLVTAKPGEGFRGQAAIGRYLQGLLAKHPMGSVAETVTMSGCDGATSTGQVLLRVTGKRKGTRMLLAGHFALTLVVRDGHWLIARHELTLNPRANRAVGTTAR